MANLSETAKVQRDYLLRNASARLEYDRHVVAEIRELNRHADTVNTWIVGISTGAIGLITTASKLANILRWQAAILFAPFVVSILAGLLFRWLNKETETAAAFTGGKKQASLIDLMLELEVSDSEERLEDARQRLEQIAQGRFDTEQIKLRAIEHHWAKWTKRVYWVPSISFMLGVLALTTLALMVWDSPAAKPSPTVIPDTTR